jgi:hypothetical protein
VRLEIWYFMFLEFLMWILLSESTRSASVDVHSFAALDF